jgi:N utilization substance protein B
MTSRRRAREIALQVLYALDANPDQDPQAVLATYFERFARAHEDGDGHDEAASETPDATYTQEMVRDVWARRTELDDVLGQLSRSWRIERMARVDRTLLRMAVWEMKYRDDIPARVTINEAIELAKRFGAEEAPAFVNGLLDSALRALDVRK